MTIERNEIYTVNIFHQSDIIPEVAVSIDWEDGKNIHHEVRKYPSTQEMLKIINRDRFVRVLELTAGVATLSIGVLMGTMVNFTSFSAQVGGVDFANIARVIVTAGGVTSFGSGLVAGINGTKEIAKLSAINRRVNASFLRFNPSPTNPNQVVSGGTQ